MRGKQLPSHGDAEDPTAKMRVTSRYRCGLYGTLVALFLAHNDFWYWRDARLVLGLPIGLFYHVVYCLAVAVVLTAIVYLAWPEQVTRDRDHDDA